MTGDVDDFVERHIALGAIVEFVLRRVCVIDFFVELGTFGV